MSKPDTASQPTDRRSGFRRKAAFTALCLVSATCPATADGTELRLARVFSSHMVIQCEMQVPVWGEASPGAKISVNIGAISATTIAAADGKWMAQLPAMPANSAAQELTIAAEGSAALTIRDVLIGDVWLCAGQSNMEFPARRDASWKVEKSSARSPLLRLMPMPYAGKGYFAKAYPPEVLARLTPAGFYEWRGWTSCEPESAGAFSAVGYFFGKQTIATRNVPVGVIDCSVGGSPAEAWVRREALASGPGTSGFVRGPWLANPLMEPWCIERAKVQLGETPGASPSDEFGPFHAFKPGFLWSAGPEHIAPFAIRGVLWYQGESNSLSHLNAPDAKWRVSQYTELFPLLVEDWRQSWKRADLPFLVVQLSSIQENAYASHFWPEFRDSQRRMAEQLPHVGLAVSSDLGHPTDVHPTNKREVARRLAYWALRYIYGDATALPCPLPISAKLAGTAVAVEFRHAGSGMKTIDGTTATTFELAGPDGVFHTATTRLESGSAHVVSSAVTTPRQVRYGWQPFSAGNVINSAGLPLSTFLLNVAP